MPTAQFRLTKRPPRAAQQHSIVLKEVRIGMKRAGDKGANMYNGAVNNWENQPQFTPSVGIGTKQSWVRINATGTQKALMLWDLINRTGARPHVINAHGTTPLTFVWGGPGSYHPKTQFFASSGGPGRVTGGKPFAAKEIFHPGFPARKFSEKFNPLIDKDVRREIRNGVTRGRRRI